VLSAYEAARERNAADAALTPLGKQQQIATAKEVAATAISAWTTKRSGALNGELTQVTAALAAHTDAAQIEQMMARLAAFDALEVSVLYHGATDDEKRIIEHVVQLMPRRPVKRGDTIGWEESVIDAETIIRAQTARVEQQYPDLVAPGIG
jgi:precorrin-4 methylase